MLAAHIQKEDQILFPAAEHHLPPPVLDALAGEFDEFGQSVVGRESQERLRSLAEELIEAFPPDRTPRNTAGGCFAGAD